MNGWFITMKNMDILYRENIIKGIKRILVSNDIDEEVIDDAILNKQLSATDHNKNFIISSDKMNLNNEDIYFIFYVVNEVNDININSEIKENLKKDLSERKENYVDIHIYFLFSTLKDKIYFNNKTKITLKPEIKKYTKKELSEKKCDIKLIYEFIGNKNQETFNIKIDSRIRSLERKRSLSISRENNQPIETDIKGYVFTANLFSIVEMYNILGNNLFESNVRYQIVDQLNVDCEIRNTLNNNPEEFWYLNNGITIIIKDKDFNLKDNTSLTLSIGKRKHLSVINGAQTISAAAEYFYSKGTDCNDSAKNLAKVMLRIICVDECSDSEYTTFINREIDKISIALNRQKPIKPEDIAYTMPFIYKINELSEAEENNKNLFMIVRRGENDVRGHDLVSFARCVKAYFAQKPGDARTKGTKTLLNIKEDAQGLLNFDDTDIFIKEFLNEEESIEEVFYKYYKPVNFAIQIERIFSSVIKKLYDKDDSDFKKLTEDKRNIIKYSRWYFVAYVIYILNNSSAEDFSKFNGNIESITNESIKEILIKYSDVFYTATKENVAESDAVKENENVEQHNSQKTDESSKQSESSEANLYDSNKFKKNDLYKIFVNYTKDNNTEEVNKLKTLIETLSDKS